MTSKAPFGIGGMVGSPTGPVLYLGDIGGGSLQLARAPTWEIETLPTRTTVLRAQVASFGDRLLLSAVELVSMKPMRIDLLIVDPRSGTTETVLAGCRPVDRPFVAVGPRREVVVATCGGTPHAFERKGTRWQPLDGATFESPVAAIALDAHDRLHILSNVSGRSQLAVLDPAPSLVPLPDDVQLHSLAACGERLYAAYERKVSPYDIGIASSDGSHWSFDLVTADTLGELVVGFDAECNPIVGHHERVWERVGDAWVATPITPSSASVQALTVHEGVVYVAFENIDRDGVRSSVQRRRLTAGGRQDTR